MNQILLTNNDNYNKKNNKKINNNNSNSNDLKKIIVFFAIVIIVFGIAIGVVYAYKTIGNSSKDKDNKPQIYLEKTDDNMVKIKIESKVGIAKVIYYWNEEERYEEDRSGNTYEKMIDIPEGENTLHVEVIDTKGQEKQTSETFINESSDIDPDDPTPGTQYSDKLKISTSITSDGKLKIVATSEEPMKYITYKWNEEEETTKYSEDEQSTSIETIIDVRSGLNTITITAEDIEGNINSVNKNFEGKFKPEIKVYKQDDKIYMKVSHYKGLKEIQYLINGNELIYDENYSEYDPEKTEVEFSFKLQEGENTVIIKATSNEDTQEEYSGSKTYHEQ